MPDWLAWIDAVALLGSVLGFAFSIGKAYQRLRDLEASVKTLFEKASDNAAKIHDGEIVATRIETTLEALGKTVTAGFGDLKGLLEKQGQMIVDHILKENGK